jgi:hypothetical protein
MTSQLRHNLTSALCLVVGLGLGLLVVMCTAAHTWDGDGYDNGYGTSRYGLGGNDRFDSNGSYRFESDSYQRSYGGHPTDTHDAYGIVKPYDQQRPSSTPPPMFSPRDYGSGTGVIGPDGKMTICRQGHANTVYCN